MRPVKLLMRTIAMTGKPESLARNTSDLWERLTVGGVVVILVAFLVLFVANLATTLCSAQLPR
jgi:hypothetical protein